ncbi:Hsp70 family protein [Kitasatospora sp. NPDC056327]|uniref:Hsp70 family protein n=1 Tax=Kitasatospora sp. NPDC056327 TaxID=3345785 RepID=UPI0035DF27E5
MSFGIDFGTSNSVVARWNGLATEVVPVDGGSVPANWQQPEFGELFPSVLSVHDLRRTLCFGWTAKTGTSAPLDAVKRMLGTRSSADRAADGDEEALPHLEEHRVWLAGEQFRSTAAAAALFSRMREGAAGELLELTEAVVTVPANATGGARYRTRAAAALGGIRVKALINEPTAAAISYAYDYPIPGRFLVFDWGGGTIDVTVLEYADGLFEEQTSRGITALGGLEFDEQLAKLILRNLGTAPERLSMAQRRQWRRHVELTKIELSHLPPDGYALFETPPSERTGRGANSTKITVEEFTAEIAPLVDRALTPVEQALKDLRISTSDIDSVLLIGGTSQIPLVRETLGRVLGHDRIVDPRLCRPMTAVARGAAIYAASLDGELNDLSDFSLVSNYDLGTAFNAGPERGFRSIIRRNATLPAEGTSAFQPSTPGAASVHVEIVEGESGYSADSDRAFPLAAFDVPLPQPEHDPARNRITIRFRYNESGILRFTATHAITGKVLAEREVDSFGPDGTPLKEGLEDELTRLLAHTVRPFQGTTEPAPPPPENAARQAAGETAVPDRTPVADTSVTVNGEAQYLAP